MSTPFYYGSYALTKALIAIFEKISSLFRKEGEAERPATRPPPRPLFLIDEPTGPALTTSSSYTVKIPLIYDPTGSLYPVYTPVKGKPAGRRLYFTYLEAASKDWFKEVEQLAKALEKRESEAEEE